MKDKGNIQKVNDSDFVGGRKDVKSQNSDVKEIKDSLKQSFKELKLFREGKLEVDSVEGLLDEL